MRGARQVLDRCDVQDAQRLLPQLCLKERRGSTFLRRQEGDVDILCLSADHLRISLSHTFFKELPGLKFSSLLNFPLYDCNL